MAARHLYHPQPLSRYWRPRTPAQWRRWAMQQPPTPAQAQELRRLGHQEPPLSHWHASQLIDELRQQQGGH